MLALIPELDYGAEELLMKLAARAPNSVLDFFESRLARVICDIDEERFEAIPFQFHHLNPSHVSVDATVARAFAWYLQDRPLFPYRGGRFIANLFPTLSAELQKSLLTILEGSDPERLGFVIKLLQSYNGGTFLQPLCKALVTALPSGDDRLEDVKHILFSTGVVRGEFGFVDVYLEKQRDLSDWIGDQDESISSFARSATADLDKMIAGERRRAEEARQLRQRSYQIPDAEDDPIGQ